MRCWISPGPSLVASGPRCKRATGVGSLEELTTHEGGPTPVAPRVSPTETIRAEIHELFADGGELLSVIEGVRDALYAGHMGLHEPPTCRLLRLVAPWTPTCRASRTPSLSGRAPRVGGWMPGRRERERTAMVGTVKWFSLERGMALSPPSRARTCLCTSAPCNRPVCSRSTRARWSSST